MEFFEKLKLDDLFYEADAKIKEGKHADAMQTLEAILAEAPDYGKAYNHLAWLYDTKYRNMAKAAEYYEKVPGVDKASVYNEYGIMYEMQGRYDEAVKKYKEAIRFTLVTANIDTYQSSIKRCQKKKELLT